MKFPPNAKKLTTIPPTTAPKPRPLLATVLGDMDVLLVDVVFEILLALVLFELSPVVTPVVVVLLVVGLSVVGVLVPGLFVSGDGLFDGEFEFGLGVLVLFAPPAPGASETMVPLPP